MTEHACTGGVGHAKGQFVGPGKAVAIKNGTVTEKANAERADMLIE